MCVGSGREGGRENADGARDRGAGASMFLGCCDVGTGGGGMEKRRTVGECVRVPSSQELYSATYLLFSFTQVLQ